MVNIAAGTFRGPLVFGDREVDLDLRQVRGGAEHSLTAMEVRLLAYLHAQSPRPIPREELLAVVWDYDPRVRTRTVDSTMFRLRQKIEVDPKNPKYLLTAFGVGYRLALPEPSQASEATPEPPTPRPLLPVTKPPTLPRTWSTALIVLALAVLALLSWRLFTLDTAPAPQWRTQRLTATPAREIEPALSPDGVMVVFARYHPEETQHDLWILDRTTLDELDERRLTHTAFHETKPQISPSGERVAVVYEREKGPFEAAVLSLATGEVEWSAPGSYERLAWLDDDKLMALLTPPTGPQEFCELARDVPPNCVRSWPRKVVDFDVAGDDILVVDDWSLWRVSRGDAPPSKISGDLGVRGVRSGSDYAAAIASASGVAGLWSIPLDGGAPTEQIPGLAYWQGFDVVDGGLVSSVTEKRDELWISGGTSPLSDHSAVTCFDMLGDKIAFSSWQQRPGGRQLVVLDRGTGESVRLRGSDCPTFSPDGAIAHGDWIEGETLEDITLGLRVRPADLSEGQFIEGRFLRTGAFSPGGARIAAVTWEGLVMIERETGETTQLVPGRFASPAWSADGRFLAASGKTADDEGLYIHDLVEGTTEHISSLRSWEAAPLWQDDSVWVLIDEKSEPALQQVFLDGTEGARRPIEVPRHGDYWGVFQVRGDPHGELIVLRKRFGGDLYWMEK